MSEAEEVSDVERVVIGESSVDAVSGTSDKANSLPDSQEDGTEVDPVKADDLAQSENREAVAEEMGSEDQTSYTAQAEGSQHGGSDKTDYIMGKEKSVEDEDMTDDSHLKNVKEVVDELDTFEAKEEGETSQTEISEDRTEAKPSSSKEETDDNDDEVDVGDLSKLTEDSRNILFGRGLVYERAGKKNCALKCYLSCLSHLTPQSNFVLLPQCLRNIADLYYRKEQYEKAILFIQAEKLFYENALIDTSEVQQKIEALQEGLETSEMTRSNEDAKIAADSLRADEYEHLAKLCVDKKQPQLALEYAGKATKLRQKIYGNDNPITKESLDFFATLYAEVGKQQYSDSMSHLTEPAEEDGVSVSPPVTPSMEKSPSSILRQRKTGESESDKKKQVRFQEPEGVPTQSETETTRQNEEFISHTLLCLLFSICFALLCVLGLWLYCSMSDSLMCKWISGELQYFYMRIKYYYYQYASTKKVKYT